MPRVRAIAAVVFALIALGHLVRIIVGGSLVAMGVRVPMWPSWIVVLVAAILAILLWRDAWSGPPAD